MLRGRARNIALYGREVLRKVASSDDPRLRKAYVTGRQVVRRTVSTLTPFQLGWVATLHSARWEDGKLELRGWAYERGYGGTAKPPIIRVRLRSRGLAPIEARVVGHVEPLANGGLKEEVLDYSPNGFAATFDTSALASHATTRIWRVEVLLTYPDHRVRGRLNRRSLFSSAALLPSVMLNPQLQARPQWSDRHGFSLQVRQPPAVATRIEVSNRSFAAELAYFGIQVSSAELRSEQGAVQLQATDLGQGRVRVSGEIPQLDPQRRWSLGGPAVDEELGTLNEVPAGRPIVPVATHRLILTDAKGAKHEVAWAVEPSTTPAGRTLPLPSIGANGEAQLIDTQAMLVVTRVELTPGASPGIRVHGRVLGELGAGSLNLVGARASRPMTLKIDADGTFTGTGSWLASSWGRQGLPPMSGRYVLRGETEDGRWLRVQADEHLVAETPRHEELAVFNCDVGVSVGGWLVLTLAAPKSAEEFGSYNQGRLAKIYHSKNLAPKDQFYFESFGGRQANCNPLALDAEIARRFPDTPRYWGVVDSSVPAPPGATPVIRGTEEWWSARGSSRFVITNEWLHRSFEHLPHQVVLQTWHGTMLKQIGLDRPTMNKVQRQVLMRERSNWDLLLSQNPHSTRIFRTAYAWDKPIWEEGYPRNDILLTGDPEPVRRLLGISADQKVILYAPTWREDREEMVNFLNLERLIGELGPEYVLLLRGHSRTIVHGADVVHPGIIDVTSYPDVADLFLAADGLITDYSSVMFDFSVTGRPMLFFTPDIAQYRDSLRGFYFDLAETAPGPLLTEQDAVTDAVVRMDANRSLYAEKYALWRQRFNPHDDGEAARRIVDRLMLYAD